MQVRFLRWQCQLLLPVLLPCAGSLRHDFFGVSADLGVRMRQEGLEVLPVLEPHEAEA